jgi:hypothetical protein
VSGDPQVRFRSRSEAGRLGPYELARVFASFPMTNPETRMLVAGVRPVDASWRVHELAVIAELASVLGGWVGLHVHRALVAGVPVAQVAEAAGQDRGGLEHTWRAWADGQVEFGLLDQAEHDRVALCLGQGTGA